MGEDGRRRSLFAPGPRNLPGPRHSLSLTRRALALVSAVWLGAVTPSGLAFARGGSEPPIAIEPGQYGPYYHLRYDLTAAGIDFPASSKSARSGGQFEIRLRPQRFPIPAPRCHGELILRMPWTPPDVQDADAKIEVKRQLLARIRALAEAPGDVVTVVLEMNPYVEVVSRDPLRLQLTQCNLFFRQAQGGYVDHTGPV